jgi:pimeloyl-ACP methyl ester carboxylesterase
MSKAQPLVLLHGALGAKEQFIALAEKLKNHLEVYTLNFEGHGGRSSERDFSLDHFMENLNDYIEGHHLHKPSIFGYSMGGYVALKFAIKYPDKVNRIMTLGTKFDWSPESAAKEIKMLNPDVIEEKVPQFAAQLKERHAPLDWKEVLYKTAAMMLALGNGEAHKPIDFKTVGCPVLITVGNADNMVSIQESQQIAQAIPKSTFEVFEGFKHPIEQVNVQVLGERVKLFLR